ncbi:hypothetical protein LSAT2_001389 [Lamellibrachia satsuma]|nr:hypothetical protein LSAT2_001389 [Lamellibrachia satsuma]
MVSSWQLLTIVAAVLLLSPTNAWLFRSSSSSGGGGGSPRTHSFDIGRRSELTRLYNQPVRRVTHVERPLTGLSTMVGPIRHSGVVVETQDGRRHLIHKGKDYGRSSQTVVTDARHMSRNWRPVQSRPVSGSSVGDFVRAGGRDYSTIGDNCHNGRCRMMALP